MARIAKKDFIRTPFGGFNKSTVGSVSPMETGVAVLDSENRMIYWHEEANAEIARTVGRAIMDAVMDGTEIDWDSFNKKPQLEHKKEAKAEVDAETKNKAQTK